MIFRNVFFFNLFFFSLYGCQGSLPFRFEDVVMAKSGIDWLDTARRYDIHLPERLNYNTTHRLPDVVILKDANSSWQDHSLMKNLRAALEQFHRCGIRPGKLEMVTATFPAGMQGTVDNMNPGFSALYQLAQNRPLLIFSDWHEPQQQIDGQTGRLHDGFDNQLSVILINFSGNHATSNNRKQTLAHELGHLFGLQHPEQARPESYDVMSVNGCWLCRFSIQQCEIILISEWLKGL